MDPLELAITTAATGYGVEEVCPPTPSVAEIIVGPTLALASVSTLSNRRVGCIQVQLVLLDRFITRVKTLVKARILQHRKYINRFFTAVILHCKYVVHLHRFFISSDSSLQSYYTANSSFTNSSLQSYHTANASILSITSIHSTSSRSSDVSLPYSVKSVNSYKSRKTVLYTRRMHPPPVEISSQVCLLLFIPLSQYRFSCRNSPSLHRSCNVLTAFGSYYPLLSVAYALIDSYLVNQIVR